MSWGQIAFLVPFLLILAVACGPTQPARNVPDATRLPAVLANPTSQVAAGSTPSTLFNPTTTNSTPIAGENPSAEVESRGTASGVLAETTLVHNGFRTEVSRTLRGEKAASRASSVAGGKQVVTVGLRNLSPATGSIQSRATINFAPDFNNFVVIPTEAGPLTLYLHRNGTLESLPDAGGFT